MTRNMNIIIFVIALPALFFKNTTTSFANPSDLEINNLPIGSICEVYEIESEIVKSECSETYIEIENIEYRRQLITLIPPGEDGHSIIAEHTGIDASLYKEDLMRLRAVNAKCASPSDCSTRSTGLGVGSFSSCEGEPFFGKTYSVFNISGRAFPVSEVGRFSICRGEEIMELSFHRKVGEIINLYSIISVRIH